MRFRRSSFFIVAVILTAWAQADAEENHRRTWRDFHDQVRDDLRTGSLLDQLAALERFAAQDYGEASEFLIDWLEKSSTPDATRPKAAEVLGRHRNLEGRKALATIVRRDPAANRHLLAAYFTGKPDDLPEIAAGLVNAEREPDPATLAIAIDALAGTGIADETTVARLAAFTAPGRHHLIRTASARALGWLPDRQSLPVLIRHLGDPLLVEEARDSLLRLTGQDFWTDAEAWRKWWESGETALAPLDEDAFEAKRLELLDRLGDGLGGDLSAMFYGRKVRGQNLLFLLDVSDSMKIGGRMDRLRHELAVMIRDLAPECRFGLVLFPHDAFPTGRIREADRPYKVQALQFVSLIQPRGFTPMGTAIKFAFEEIVPEENVDALYLLSDGEPTDYPRERVRELIREYNEAHGVAIHTIWLGGSGNDFLRAVAEENEGLYWEAP